MPNNSANALKDALDRRSDEAKKNFMLRVIEKTGWSFQTYCNKRDGKTGITKLEAEAVKVLDKKLDA